jgi:hypothetical protein
MILFLGFAVSVMTQAFGGVKPQFTLWAWQRDENLNFLKAYPTVGVAYFAGLLRIQPDSLRLFPRTNRLTIPAGIRTTPVIRIEVDAGAETTDERAETAAKLITKLSRAQNSQRLQIDFDARKSERKFYRLLLQKLRTQLPKHDLSMTALASWCMGDYWLKNLPVNETVPMLFDMTHLHDVNPQDIQSADSWHCGDSLGVASYAMPPLRRAQKYYLFTSKPWNEKKFLEMKENLIEK